MQTYNAVKDCMSTLPPGIPSSTLIFEAIEKLAEYPVAAAPVVDGKNEIIGFISEHECISTVLQRGYYCDPAATVNEVMCTEMEAVQAWDNIVDLAQKMLSTPRQVFPVADNHKLIGMVNRSMVLHALKEQLA